MLPKYTDERLALIARLYYLDGLGQNEVAKLAGVSQAKVSRLLALAKERGIVSITVADYNPRHGPLEERLQKRFDLLCAVVIKSGEGRKGADLRRTVGYFGAAVVDALLAPRDIVALAGGRTIHELVQHLPASQAKSLTVVQAMGSVDAHISVVDAQEIGRILAQRLGGVFLSLNAPAFIPERRTRDALLNLEQVRGVQETLRRAKVALVGIGTLSNSVFVERGTLDAAMVGELQRAGAVGEICGRFIDIHGNECATAWRDRVISVPIEQLRKIPQVIAVVSGSDRSAAILAAIKGRVVKSLVIDDIGAAALLAYTGPGPADSLKKKPKSKDIRE